MKQIKREHTIEDIKRIIRGIDKKTGKNYAKLPVKISKRMTCSLASAETCMSRRNGEIIKVEPDSFKFSYFFLKANLTDKDFSDIVIHEYSHLYTNEKYADFCNHDYRYKNTCKELGIPHMGGYRCTKEVGEEFEETIRLYKLGALE